MGKAGQRRQLLRAGAAAALAWRVPGALAAPAEERPGALPPAAAAQGAGCAPWADWQDFQAAFLGAGDRVIDPASARAVTVSEGQAYALFFALVAGERVRFERLLRWTEDNLARGDLSLHLPAWQWGRRDDGSWGVLDANSASDADLWLVYALGEAGRLWRERRYLALSSVLAERVLREETVQLPGLGRAPAAGFCARRRRLAPQPLLPAALSRALAGGAQRRSALGRRARAAPAPAARVGAARLRAGLGLGAQRARRGRRAFRQRAGARRRSPRQL